MTRYRHKSWQDRRPAPSRKVTWFKPGQDSESIRMEFIDLFGRRNRFYRDEVLAYYMYELFIDNQVSTKGLALEIAEEDYENSKNTAVLRDRIPSKPHNNNGS